MWIKIVKVRKDLTDQRFGRLVVIKQAEDYISNGGNHYARWLCKCDCGNEIIAYDSKIKSGHTKSCGCFQQEVRIECHKKYNTYDLTGEYGIGYTSKGEKFYFDLEDYDLIKDYYWYISSYNYVCSITNKKHINMHRLVTNCPDNLVPDHIHGYNSRNDNRKSNLRIVTRSQNNMNKGLQINNSSGEKWVYFNRNTNKWYAQITLNNKTINLGNYKNFDDAIKARQEAEEEYFGEYSYTNSQKMPIE